MTAWRAYALGAGLGAVLLADRAPPSPAGAFHSAANVARRGQCGRIDQIYLPFRVNWMGNRSLGGRGDAPDAKAFLFRLFALLFALLLLITASSGAGSLPLRPPGGGAGVHPPQPGGPCGRSATPLGQGMTDTQTLAKRIAESTQLIELLSGPCRRAGGRGRPRSALTA